jgi:hypothetical protein
MGQAGHEGNLAVEAAVETARFVQAQQVHHVAALCVRLVRATG